MNEFVPLPLPQNIEYCKEKNHAKPFQNPS
jgi:hypothetical protein